MLWPSAREASSIASKNISTARMRVRCTQAESSSITLKPEPAAVQQQHDEQHDDDEADAAARVGARLPAVETAAEADDEEDNNQNEKHRGLLSLGEKFSRILSTCAQVDLITSRQRYRVRFGRRHARRRQRH